MGHTSQFICMFSNFWLQTSHWKYIVEPGEIAQWLKACTAFAEDLSSFSNTHIVWLTATSFHGHLLHVHIPRHRHTYAHEHTLNLKIDIRKEVILYKLSLCFLKTCSVVVVFFYSLFFWGPATQLSNKYSESYSCLWMSSLSLVYFLLAFLKLSRLPFAQIFALLLLLFILSVWQPHLFLSHLATGRSDLYQANQMF